MNPQPVSLDFTNNVVSKSSANSVKPPADRSEAGDDQFKKELSKQENSHQDEVAKAKPQEKPEQKTTEPVSEEEQRVSVAADDMQNGEELPEPEVTTENLIQQIQPELLTDESVTEVLGLVDIKPELKTMDDSLDVVSESVLSLSVESDFSTTMTDLNMSVVDGGGDGVVDQVNLLRVQSEAGHVVVPGLVPGLVPGVAPVNTVMNPENPLNSLNLESELQPVEKLMTLNQVKASLENSLETMAELEIDVDLDADNTIKEVMRFNDIQLKENQSALKSYTTSVPVPMSQATWGEQVSDKIVWLANQKIQFAEIHINPQELGPVEVKINVQNDQAAITFTSPHQGVRDLLEMSVNRLREMMSENGVDLAHVDVSDQSSQHDSQGEGETGEAGLAGVEGDGVDLDGAEATTLSIEQENLVDYYA